MKKIMFNDKYGCNVGWNDCYLFHEDLIQKGLNQQ